jgi:hypothetical protein
MILAGRHQKSQNAILAVLTEGENDASLCGFSSTRHCHRCGAATRGARSKRPCGNISSGHHARNSGDIIAMMALFTDDAVREDGSCQPPCVGLAAVRAMPAKDQTRHDVLP